MKKAVVVDLDGTLLKTNTFIQYIKFVCKEAMKRGDVICAGWISLLVFFRKIRLISSHEKLKKRILIGSRFYTNEVRMGQLTDRLCQFENQEVIRLLNKYRDLGYTTVLSSAAPGVYADIIGRRYGFDYICSTEMPNYKDWHENVNEQKKKNTLFLLEENLLELAVLLTDHYDDLPLLLMEKEENYVINPTEKSKRKMENEHVKCKYIYGE